MTIIAFVSTQKELSVFAICDVMEEHFKWHMERQQYPDCVHMTLMPSHTNTKHQLVEDLKKSVDMVRENPNLNKLGSAALYGMVARIPSNALVDEFLLTMMGKMYS